MHDGGDDHRGCRRRREQQAGEPVEPGAHLDRLGGLPEPEGVLHRVGDGRAGAAHGVLGQTEVRGGEDVQAGQGLLRRALPGRQQRPQVGMDAYGVGRELTEPRVLRLHGHGLAVHELAAKPFQLHARAFELRARPGTAQCRLGGHLGGAAAQDPVAEQPVHSHPGRGDRVPDAGEVEQRRQGVGGTQADVVAGRNGHDGQR